MMFRTALTSLFVFMFWLWPGISLAQVKPAYTVTDVKVDIVAESSVKARNEAFAAAQAKAFGMLADRFLTPEQKASLTPPSAATISGLVSDFEITSEQMSKKRYLGVYVFRFKEIPVNRYFGHGPLQGGEGVIGASRLLVIPVFTQKNESYLWDLKNNPWLQAWQNAHKDAEDGLTIPEGNVSDKMDMRDARIDKITRSSLNRMKSRYSATDVVILEAVFDQKAENKLKVDIYRTDRGRIELTQTVPVPIGQSKKLGELLTKAVPQLETVLNTDWRGVSQDSYADTNDHYNAEVYEEINTAQAAPSTQASAGQVRVQSRFNSIADWLSIRRGLNGIQSLKSIRILALSTNHASMELVYSDWMALTSAISSRGLALQPLGPGEYNLIRMTR